MKSEERHSPLRWVSGVLIAAWLLTVFGIVRQVLKCLKLGIATGQFGRPGLDAVPVPLSQTEIPFHAVEAGRYVLIALLLSFALYRVRKCRDTARLVRPDDPA